MTTMPLQGNLNKVHIETSLFASLQTEFQEEFSVQTI